MALRVLSSVLCAIAVAAVPAGAVVPPKDCGRMKAKHRKYDVKADQIPCKKARPLLKAFINKGHKPKGWHCFHYADSAQEYRCEKGIKVIYGNRR
jgi:hypothetical protein